MARAVNWQWDAMLGQQIGDWVCIGTAWGGIVEGITFRFQHNDGAIAELSKPDHVLCKYDITALIEECCDLLGVDATETALPSEGSPQELNMPAILYMKGIDNLRMKIPPLLAPYIGGFFKRLHKDGRVDYRVLIQEAD